MRVLLPKESIVHRGLRVQGAKVRAGIPFSWLEGFRSGVTNATQRPEV